MRPHIVVDKLMKPLERESDPEFQQKRRVTIEHIDHKPEWRKHVSVENNGHVPTVSMTLRDVYQGGKGISFTNGASVLTFPDRPTA